jgi:hypothetical protein
LINCCWEKVAREIANRLRTEQTDVNVDHYIYTGDRVGLAASYIRAILPFLRMRNYRPYRVDGMMIGDELPVIVAINIAICRNNSPDGKVREAILRFDYNKTGHIEIIERSAEHGTYALIRTIVESYSHMYKPMRLDLLPCEGAKRICGFVGRLMELSGIGRFI